MVLQTRAGQIVDEQGQAVWLRGVCIGGWMNMENFINGYPGSEHGLRAAMTEAIGASRSHFFFERWLDHMFSEADVAFLKGLGATVVRLPFNYRHFESDESPLVYREAAFARLSQTIRWCEAHGLYVILDLHAVQGWQNPDWHSDNASRHALFWQSRQDQDRFVALWQEIARRYRGDRTVAGYNVMNEPVSGAPRGRFSGAYQTNWDALNAAYRRVVAAIREIDPEHIIFLEGDFYSLRFSGLEAPFADNLVYSSHNYNAAGFGPGAYPGQNGGEHWDAQKQAEVFEQGEGTRFTRQHQVPLWIGEFGSVFSGNPAEHADRVRALDDQLGVFNGGGAHWTLWTYKDVETMGWVMLRPECEYRERVGRVLQLKRTLGTDSWTYWMPPSDIMRLVEDIAQRAARALDDPALSAKDITSPLKQAALDGFFGGLLQPVFAAAFRGLSENDLDRVLSSFSLAQCQQNEPLLAAVQKHLRAR